MLNLEIDKLTNSIEHAVTGETFETLVVQVEASNLKSLGVRSWVFDWKKEFANQSRQLYKLVATADKSIIHGLLSLSINEDHIFMHLIENSKGNKGANKQYLGVAGNLIAYACKLSFENGFDGIVVFESKTSLITHYQISVGAKILAGNRMFIDTKESSLLVKRYFK